MNETLIDGEHCPECGGGVSLDDEGRRVCLVRWNFVEFSCGWEEPEP
jgi:hypothetical protein